MVFFSSSRSHREYTKFDDDSLFFGLPVFSTTFCIIQFLAHPHQINWTNSLTFNPIYSKLKASAEGTSFEMPKNSLFFTEKNQFRSDLMSQCTTACSNTACATSPVHHRLCHAACSTQQTAKKKQKLCYP